MIMPWRPGLFLRHNERVRGFGLGLLLLGSACIVEKLEPGEVCKDIVSSISNRTFACTKDFKLANERAKRFQGQLRCTADSTTNLEEVYACPVAIGALDCDRVKANGDDLPSWLAASSQCALVTGGQP